MKKDFAKRLLLSSTMPFTVFVMHTTGPFLLPYFDSLGQINIAGFSIRVFSILAFTMFGCFYLMVYFSLAKVVDKMMK